MTPLSRFTLSSGILAMGLMLSIVGCSDSIAGPDPAEPPVLPPVDSQKMTAAAISVFHSRSRILTALSRRELVPTLEGSLTQLERGLTEGAAPQLVRDQVLAAAAALNRYALGAPLWEGPDLTVIRLSLFHAGSLVGLTSQDIQSA